jgi:hypothetical protein
MTPVRSALTAQGVYYVASGIAPFVSRRAFEAVTGRKREWWLVQTVGLLVTTVGAGVLSAVARDRVTPELAGIAAGSAASLAAIDVVHVARGRIAPTYLLDAAVEAAFLAAVARGVRKRRAEESRKSGGALTPR